MRTAVEYSESVDKEAMAGLAYKAFSKLTTGASKMFGKQTGVSMIKAKNKLKAMKTSAGISAKKHYDSYKKGSMYKRYGDKPLVVGGILAGGALGSAATGGQPLAYRQQNLSGSRQIRI